ncbi:Uma2 family endonuclease [Roseimaritima ulvae]|uniref:Putative restriction endonuclease domain-containing protein n=1 Tax=Roseimaritima ulvae TaxID=980254 RepID=A0A5B9QUA0_9BACT|nr:Uma2 family endonuclease [Roseimaritima ulvae]QEG42618.1 hypothetical protein UC8_46600 [Roseimaritima ulvae]
MSSASPRYLPHYTVDDFSQWQGDWELWDGIAVAMTPSPFGRHQQVAANLLSQLLVQRNQQQCDAQVLHEIDWVVANDTVVRPDLVVLCGEVPQRHVMRPPALVAEVLSESTAQRDRTVKFQLYQQQQVPYYLILDPETATLEIWTLTEKRVYRRATAEEQDLRVCEDCRLRIEPEKLF